LNTHLFKRPKTSEEGTPSKNSQDGRNEYETNILLEDVEGHSAPMTRRLTSKFETAANVLEQIGAVESIKEKQEIEEKFTD